MAERDLLDDLLNYVPELENTIQQCNENYLNSNFDVLEHCIHNLESQLQIISCFTSSMRSPSCSDAIRGALDQILIVVADYHLHFTESLNQEADRKFKVYYL